MQIPGIGVKFEDINEGQFVEIRKKIGDPQKLIS